MNFKEDPSHQSHLLPDDIKHAIILHKKKGETTDKQIARDILSTFGRKLGNSTVSTLWEKYQKTHTIANNWNTEGRPKLLNEEDDEMLIEAVRENRLSSAKDLKDDLELPVSRETVNRELLSLGYKAYKAPAKPLLKPENMDERYAFADKYQSWGVIRWRKVIFTDESAFQLVSSNGRVFVRRLEEEQLEPFAIQACVSSSSMVMVWGAISTEGVGPLVRVEGTLDGSEYLNLFRYRLWKYYPRLYNGSLIFQDDNATPHKSDIVNQWFHKYSIRRMDWPSRSPDLNIIEDVWNELKFKMRGKTFETKDDLWEEIKKQWLQLSPDFINGLYATLPDRIRAVLNAHGGSTIY